MQPKSIAVYMGISVDEAGRLLALSPAAVYDDSAYQDAVNRLDVDLLRHTLVHVRAAYENGLDPIKEKYGLSDTVMSGFTLGNWVLGFLADPDHMNDMLERHARIPTDVIENALPELVGLLEDIPEGRAEWQRALVTFSLPLIARG
jgi:hypothetical protein